MRVRVRVGVRGRVEEAVAGVARLQALSRTHEARDAVHRGAAGQRGRQPGIQGEGVGHGTHAAVNRPWPVERQHRRVVELHGARVHFFLPTPLGSAVLEPDLQDEIHHEVRLVNLILLDDEVSRPSKSSEGRRTKEEEEKRGGGLARGKKTRSL